MTARPPAGSANRRQYIVAPDRSAVLVEVSTSLGPITFGALGLEGFVRAAVRDATLDLAAAPEAHLDLQVRNLTSGNAAYDGELQRLIDARRYPAAYVDLHQVQRVEGSASTYRVTGAVVLRGVTQVIEGRVDVDLPEPGVMLIRGTRDLDVRLFEVPTPTAFMFKIQPEVTLSLELDAKLTRR